TETFSETDEGPFSATDEGPFNPLRRSRYSDFCPVANKSTPKNVMRSTPLSSTRRGKGETNWPHISRTPKASPPARRPETSGRLTVDRISRSEIGVPCMHHTICGITHNVITAE